MISSPLQVLLLGAYAPFTTELVAACARAPFAVNLHQVPSNTDTDAAWEWAVQLRERVAGPAVLICGDAPANGQRAAIPETLLSHTDRALPVLVLGSSDAARQRAWEAAGVYRYLDNADDEVLAEMLLDIYGAQMAYPPMATRGEAAEVSGTMQTMLLSEMSHEVRTPLTTILGFAEVLAQSTDGEQQMLATMIMQGSKRLANIVNSVLDLACVDAGQQPLERERIDVAAEVAEVVSFFVPQAVNKNVELRVDPPSTPTWADVDVAMLARVVNNLVGNAVKFTEAGQIRVTVAATDATLTLTVADTGTGIDAAFLPDLFNAFRQGSRLHRQRGSGLGLAITRRLVHLAGGTISVDTKPRVGTTFTVALPRFADSPQLPRAVVQQMAAASQHPSGTPVADPDTPSDVSSSVPHHTHATLQHS